MPRLIRNAARCLHCGEVIESRHRHDYVKCSCGNIAVDGGPTYARMAGRGLDDASYEPLHEYDDGQTTAGMQFLSFLIGRLPWDRGDGFALHRLLAAMVTGTIPDPDELSDAGQRRLGYLAEIVLTMSPEPAPERCLRQLIEELRERIGSEPLGAESSGPLWLPDALAGADQRAWSWGLAIGLNSRFRRLLRTKIE